MKYFTQHENVYESIFGTTATRIDLFAPRLASAYAADKLVPKDYDLAAEAVEVLAGLGVKASKAAVNHCIGAWRHDYKSGYRDEANGIHVFAPCGCNTLRISISPLKPEWSSWQTTYEC